MRLIDADELEPDADYYDGDFWAVSMSQIQDAPTIEPRKTGKWIKHIDDLFPTESTIECNVCHHEQPLTIDDNYCPNCGLKMINGDGVL